MNNAKTTRRALLSSVVALVICVTMLMGTTFAWFTDTAKVSVNTIQSGTLKIDLVDANNKSIVGNPLDFVKAAGHENEPLLWEPGCTYKLNDVFVKNDGNLAVKYQVVITGIGGDAKLNEAIEWTITYADNGTDGGAIAGSNGEYFLLPGKTSGAISISGHMKEAAGNEYQNLKIDNIAITVNATQWTYEYDSSVNTYDSMAEYDKSVSVQTEKELIEALNDGKDVILDADIELTETIAIAEANNVTIDLNGNNLTFATDGATAIENRGTLTIEDAEGTGSITARIGVSNYGTLILNSGTVVADEQGGAAIYNNAGSDANFTMNGGTLKVTFVGSSGDSTGGACIRNTGDSVTTITGGTLESRSARTYAIISNGTLNITPAAGSDVSMTAYRGIAIDDGTANINGGTFTVLDANEEEGKHVAWETYYALYVGGNDSVVIVNGGTFTAPDSSVWRPDWDEAATDLIINGGTFNGSLIGNAGYYPSKYIVVYGGTFNENPETYVANGHTATDNGDGTWTVK